MIYDNSGLVVAAIYARVSTMQQAADDRVSLNDQTDKMLVYAEQNNIHVPDAYHFREAASGLKDEREEYDKLRKLIRERKANALIVYASDRHTRDPIHGKIFRAELRRSKATLHIVSEGGEVDIYSAQGELMATIKDAFNRYWLDKILQTTYEKKQAYLRRGIPFLQGQVRFGYKRVGKRDKAVAVVDEEVRPIIQRIYDLADEEYSIYAISRLISGTMAPGGRKKGFHRVRPEGQWDHGAVRSILRDEVYAGVFYGNRTEIIEDDNGKRRTVERPRDEWVPVQVPPIISREQWERVQQKLDAANSERPKRHAKYNYLLARKLRCGVCGKSGTTYPAYRNGEVVLYYRCSTQTDPTRATLPCTLPMFRADTTDREVWRTFVDVLTHPETFLLQMDNAKLQHQNDLSNDQAQLREVNDLIANHKAELAVLVSEFARFRAKDSPLATAVEQQAEKLAEVVSELEKRKITLERRIASLSFSAEDVSSLAELAQTISAHLQTEQFERRRALVERMGWRFELQEHQGERVVVVLWRTLRIPIVVPHKRKIRKRKE